MERGGEVDSKERRGRVQRWLADATFYNREEGPTKDLLAGEREREENLCEDSHKFWQVVLLAMKNQNFSFQAPPSFFRVSRNEARRSKLVQRKTRQGSSREKILEIGIELDDYFVRGPRDRFQDRRSEERERERGCEPILLFLFFTTRRVRASSNLASFYLLALGPAFLNANFGPADSVR